MSISCKFMEKKMMLFYHKIQTITWGSAEVILGGPFLDFKAASSIFLLAWFFQGDKLRPCNDWQKWIMPPAIRFPDASGAQSSGDSVAASVRTLSLDERAGNNEAGKAEAGTRSSRSTSTGN